MVINAVHPAREEVKVRITPPMKPVDSRGQPNLEIRYDENTASNRCIDSSSPTKSNHLFSERVRGLGLGGNSAQCSPASYEAQTNP